MGRRESLLYGPVPVTGTVPVFLQYMTCTGTELRTPKPLTSAPPGTRRSAVTDAVRLAPSLLPRLGAVATTVTTTELDRVSGVVCDDAREGARVPGSLACGLARMCRWVGLVLRLVLVGS